MLLCLGILKFKRKVCWLVAGHYWGVLRRVQGQSFISFPLFVRYEKIDGIEAVCIRQIIGLGDGASFVLLENGRALGMRPELRFEI